MKPYAVREVNREAGLMVEGGRRVNPNSWAGAG